MGQGVRYVRNFYSAYLYSKRMTRFIGSANMGTTYQLYLCTFCTYRFLSRHPVVVPRTIVMLLPTYVDYPYCSPFFSLPSAVRWLVSLFVIFIMLPFSARLPQKEKSPC